LAINLATLFADLGKVAKILGGIESYTGGTLVTDLATALSTAGTTYASELSAIAVSAAGMKFAVPGNVAGIVQQSARALLLRFVNDDALQSNNRDMPLALKELIAQMKTAVASVPSVTVTATAAAGGSNTGTGKCVVSTYRGDGLTQQNQFAETAVLTCTGDAQNGTAAAAREPFNFSGDQAAGLFSSDWPGASGAFLSVQAVDSTVSNQSTGNLLTNSDFETFTVANTPDFWPILVGSAGTTVKKQTGQFYKGLAALEFAGNGAENTSVAQTFNDATLGTGAVLRPNRVYNFFVALRVSATPAAGVLTVDLCDGSNTTINDDQAAANSFTVALTALTSSWNTSLGVGTFRTPKTLPATVKLRMRLSTALDNAKSLYMDSAALAEASFLYPGGPALSVFAGATPFMTNDYFTITTANNRNGKTFGMTWQAVFDRLFGMRQLGLLLPYSGSPTLADTLLA
jgi:hypothetical protein